MLLDATHRLFNWLTVQFCTVFCSSHREQQAIEHPSSHGWVWQACAGLDPTSLSVVFFVCGICWAQFSSGRCVQSYLICLLICQVFSLLFFWPCSIFVTTTWKKNEWMCSMHIVLSKSFLFQRSYYSFSPSWPQFWDLCHSYSGRVLLAASHVDRTAPAIEPEPSTFTIVVAHSRRKVERFKHYQRCLVKNVTAESACVVLRSLGRVGPLVPLKQWCKGLS